MRLILRILWSATAVLCASRCLADSGGAPVLAPPPTSAIPAPEAPSEPWKPPAGTAPTPDANASTAALVPGAEQLPLPGTTDPTSPAAEGAPNVVVDEPSSWYSPIVWLGPAPWDTGVEFGLNGSSGTSDALSLRAGAYIKRESRFSKIDFETDYNLTMERGTSTQNNGKVDITNDWLIDEASPWTLFAKSDLFYDKFASYDLQTDLNAGVGYRWIHTPEVDMMTRVGGGASHEFGGPDNQWTPESLFGFEYSQKVTQTQKFYAKLDYYPQWDPVGEFRLVADMGWEIALVQPSNLSLKISASDRYDSTPDGVNPNLLNYSVLLLLKL